MAFKIPKRKKQWEEPETDSVAMQSPLSRLQDSTPVATNGWGVANRARGVANGARGVANGAGTNRVHSGNGLTTSRDAAQRPAVKKDVRGIIRKLLGLDEPPMTSGAVVAPAANRRCHAAGGGDARWSNRAAADGSSPRGGGQSTGTVPTQQPASNGWRPRRASDRLLSATSEEDSRSTTQRRRDSVVSVDSSEQATTDSTGRTSDRPNETSRQTQRPARDPFRWSPSPPPSSPPPLPSTSSPALLSTSLVPRRRRTGLSLAARRTVRDTRRTPVFSRAPTEPIVLSSEEEDIEDTEDIECGVKTSEGSRSVHDSSDKGSRAVETSAGGSRAVETSAGGSRAVETSAGGSRAVETSAGGSRAVETSAGGSRAVETSAGGSRAVETSAGGGRRVQDDVSTESSPPPSPPPASVRGACSSSSSSSVMELHFSRLLLGQLSAQAHGNVLITEDGINIPLKGPHSDSELAGECLSVAVVTSQLRGYGVWEEGVAAGSHAPSLLFLWVTDSQAGLLQTELSVLQPVTAAEGACPFILVELASPLAPLRAALLRSLLDMYGTAASRPLSVSVDHALSMLTHGHAPLLAAALRGHDTAAGVSSRLRSRAALCLTTRLIQYPLTPGKGRIAVTTEDLCCLDEGEFLNDVIIDFYLKYLLLECSGIMSERCHVFSSFFYRQLTKRRTTEEEPQPLDRVSRHQRVKTWTRNVDIFDKDFLFVPVNQESHWYLVMVCFPGLVKDHMEETSSSCMSSTHHEGQEEVKRPRPHEERQEEVKRPRPHEEEQQEEVKRPRLTRGLRARGEQSITTPPECTRLGWKRETALKRPCILVMDSLKRSCHENVCKLLRDYLCVEWRERRQSARLFSSESMKSSNCRLPLQDNSSDCGLYLLQYVETFLKNPVVHFDLPVCLENWFPRQQVRKKREEIRRLVMEMHRRQNSDKPV